MLYVVQSRAKYEPPWWLLVIVLVILYFFQSAINIASNNFVLLQVFKRKRKNAYIKQFIAYNNSEWGLQE